MKTLIQEKFEVTILNPGSRQFEGGSYHASVEVEGFINRHNVKSIQDVIDQFDHSTIVPSQLVTVDEVANISKRYTVIENAVSMQDIFAGMARVIVGNILNSKIEIEAIVSISFSNDNNDATYIVDLQDTEKVVIVAHEA